MTNRYEKLLRLSELESDTNYTSSYVLYRYTPTAQVLKSVTMFESSMAESILESSGMNMWYFICRVNKQYKFGCLHLTTTKKWSDDLRDQCIRRCHVKCSILLVASAMVRKNSLWNEWRFAFLRFLSTQQL